MLPLLDELRIFYGSGYRVYFVQRNSVVVILLSGGDKTSQQSNNTSQLAIDTGLTREESYKVFSAEEIPTFATVAKVAKAPDLKITFQVAH